MHVFVRQARDHATLLLRLYEEAESEHVNDQRKSKETELAGECRSHLLLRRRLLVVFVGGGKVSGVSRQAAP